jgi:hypothetical protein
VISLDWWVIPCGVWFALVLICGIVAHMEVPGAELAAGSLFIGGSLLCAAFLICCLVISK